MPRAQSHPHKLKRYRYKTGSAVYFCTLPDCNYKVDVELTLGKRIECWRCGKEFKQNEYSIRLAKPHCHDCTKSKIEVRDEVTELTKTVAAEATESLKNRLSKVSTALMEKDEGGEI